MPSKGLPAKVKKESALAEVPAFNSDRLRLLAPLITPRVLELARDRLLNHTERLVDENMKCVGDDRAAVQLALIVLREMSPSAHLTNPEEGVLRGMDRKSFGRMVARGEL